MGLRRIPSVAVTKLKSSRRTTGNPKERLDSMVIKFIHFSPHHPEISIRFDYSIGCNQFDPAATGAARHHDRQPRGVDQSKTGRPAIKGKARHLIEPGAQNLNYRICPPPVRREAQDRDRVLLDRLTADGLYGRQEIYQTMISPARAASGRVWRAR